MSFHSLFVLTLLTFSSITSALPAATITAQLRSQLSPGSKIYLPSDVNYTEEVTARWTIYDGPTFRAVIQPASESDVQTIVSSSLPSMRFVLTLLRGKNCLGQQYKFYGHWRRSWLHDNVSKPQERHINSNELIPVRVCQCGEQYDDNRWIYSFSRHVRPLI